MALLTKLNNPFDINDKEVSEISHGVAVFYYLNSEKEGIEFVASVNGAIIEDYTYILKEKDHLAFVAIPKGGGGGGSNPLKTVAMVALVIAAPYAAGALMGATAGMVGAGVYGGMSGALIYGGIQAAVIIGGGLLINTLMPTPQPAGLNSSSLENVSPTYSFSGGGNAQAAGSALPIMLGEARVTPPIIGSYISLAGDKQHINILMAVNDGVVDDITDVEINGQPIANYNEVSFSITKGANNQAAIGNFRDSVLTTSLQRGLNELNAVTTYTTAGNSVQELEVVVAFPKGLYYVNDNGNYTSRTVQFDIQYRPTGETTWYLGHSESITDTFKTTKRLAYKLSNKLPNQYEIRVIRTSDYSTNTRVANDFTLDYVNEIVYDDFTYPNVALLSVNAMATDQLNGGMPTVTCKCINIGTVKQKNNPAWACYDLLKREGISDNDINLDKFQEWAEYCNFKGYTCNLYLDAQHELQAALNMVSILGRATVVQFGSTFTPIIDKAVEIPTQSFLFTSGNIVDSSFSLDYVPYNERSNVVEVTYYDETDGYKSKTVQVQSHDYDITTIEKKSAVNLYGCTKQQHAANYAQFLLNNNRYITETVSFVASIDAIACTVGDVIKVGKKYMTNTMADGRIVSATNTTITLDQEVFLTANELYEIQIRLATDEIITIDVPAVAEDTLTDTLTVSEMAIIPQQFDVFAFGLQTTEATNLYRVASVTRDTDLTRKIQAIEYNADVYNDSAVIRVEEVIYVDNVANLQADEVLIKNATGTVDEILTLSWTSSKSENPVYVDGNYVGMSYANTYEFKNELIQGETYVFKVGNCEITHKFIGKSDIPANVNNFLFEENKSGKKLTWSKNTEVDLKGYKIKYNYGTSTDWNNGVDLFDGYLSVNSYEGAFPNIQGTYTFMIKAMDTSLNESLSPETIVMNVADVKINNLIETYDFSNFIGEKTNCIVDENGVLIANGLNALMYDLADTEQFYDKQDSAIFYAGTYEEMIYIDNFTAGATAKAVLQYSGSSDAKFYYKKDYNRPLYNFENLMYYKNDTDLMYEDVEYQAYVNGFDVVYGENVTIKVDYPQTEAQSSIASLKIVVDADDIIEKLNDFTVQAGGTTYTSNSIDIIKNVQATLQGGSGINFQYTKSNNSVTINVYDASGTDVGGLCDLILTGYKI